ncbi:MAG: YidC/Oxa1 family membrane protein insertase [Candidatus Aldehydirespiratoraceae bacterium]|jgi:YidC/Oxa1 family membrane protein insertase
MFDLIASVLAFFYDKVWASYGVSIILLTLAVMVVATPLTLKSTKSMLQMQRLQPELKAIQNRYKDDRPKMNEELMAFYQENGINPLGGCLPMLIQLPIFLVLFRVVQGITRRATNIGSQFGWTAGRTGSGGSAGFEARQSTELMFDPENLPHDSQMYIDLTNENEMVSWSIDLSRSAQQVLSESVVSAIPYLLLIVIVLVSSLYQQRQIQGRNTGAQVNSQQQMIMKILPFMLPVFSFTMPAALVIYFVVSNLYRIGQQGYITQSLYKGDNSPGAQLAKQRASDKAGGKSGADRGNGGRTTQKKGDPTPKRGETKPAAKGAKTKGAGTKTSSKKTNKKKSATNSGAGRTGKAPSRETRTGGRTTDPGSPQHKKRKK